MRIIAGKFKGRILDCPKDNSIRPATDRAKGVIFNVLQNRLNLVGANVLDLFAGSGSLAFEALSRGASGAVFVENRKSVLDFIRSNAEKLDCLDACEIVLSDAESYIKTEMIQYDLIFADPPYAYAETGEFPLLVFQGKLLKCAGFLIIEHEKQTTFQTSPLYRMEIQKQFGSTRISFFSHSS